MSSWGHSRSSITGDGGLCARPEEGCSCDDGSPPVPCYFEPLNLDGQLVCHAGTRYCRKGSWSTCESVREYRYSNATALVDGPSACNPCNPTCAVSRDYPTTADLNAMNSTTTTIRYDSTAGGIVLNSSGSSGGTVTDTDGDGVPDIADDYPSDATRTGIESGYYHSLPYGGSAVMDPLDFSLQVRTADVYFLMDTTGSMGGEILNLRTALTTGTFITGCSGGIIGAIKCTIPDTWFGVGRFEDYPISPYGSASWGDTVYTHMLDIQSSSSATQTSVNTLSTKNGNDWPEAHTQALWATATGLGLGDKLAARASACTTGRFGYPCFRSDAIPIIILFTDAPFHNGPNTSYDYDINPPGSALPSPTAVAGNDNQGTARVISGNIETQWVGFSGSTSSLTNDVTAGCGANNRDAVFRFTVGTTSTVTISLENSSFDTVLSLRDSSFNETMCNDDAVGTQSRIITSLTPGTYYVVVDGRPGGGSGRGSYQLSIGVPPPVVTLGYPVTWSQAQTALTTRNIRLISVESSGGYADAKSNLNSLANATSSVDSTGNPYVFSVTTEGVGLSTAVVNAVVQLANYSRFNVSAVALDNPATASLDERAFVQSLSAVSFPAGRCTGISGGTIFQQCLPGTTLNFQASFRNNVVMPTTVAQVFTFNIQVLYDGTTVAQTVPVRIVIPPVTAAYPVSGSYWRDYDASARCTIPPERPDWGNLQWTATTPAGTRIDFELRTGNTAAAAAAATPVTFTVPSSVSPIDVGDRLVAGGQQNLLPFLRITTVLNSTADQTQTPVLTGFELQYTCLPVE